MGRFPLHAYSRLKRQPSKGARTFAPLAAPPSVPPPPARARRVPVRRGLYDPELPRFDGRCYSQPKRIRRDLSELAPGSGTVEQEPYGVRGTFVVDRVGLHFNIREALSPYNKPDSSSEIVHDVPGWAKT